MPNAVGKEGEKGRSEAREARPGEVSISLGIEGEVVWEGLGGLGGDCCLRWIDLQGVEKPRHPSTAKDGTCGLGEGAKIHAMLVQPALLAPQGQVPYLPGAAKGETLKRHEMG